MKSRVAIIHKLKCGAGYSLIHTFIVILLLVIIVASLVSQLTYHSRFALLEFHSQGAFDLARSGIARAKLELLADPSWASSNPGVIEDEYGVYEVSVIPGEPGKNCWKVTSRGKHYDSSRRTFDSTRVLTAWLKEESSLEYLSWSQKESSDPYGNAWLLNKETFAGAYHTDGFICVAGRPEFGAFLSSGNLDDPLYDDRSATYQGGKYSDSRYFYHSYSSYETDVPVAAKSGSGPCLEGATYCAPFPPFDEKWKKNAQVYYNEDVEISFLSTGDMVVKSGKKGDTLPSGNTIYIKGGAALKGRVKGRPVILAEKDIILKESITYTDNLSDLLVLVSGGSIILDTPPSKSDVSVNGYMASLGGTFLVKDYDKEGPRGTLTLFGAILQKYATPANTFSSGNYEVASGFSRKFSYDSRVQSLPSWIPRATFMRSLEFLDESVSAGGI